MGDVMGVKIQKPGEPGHPGGNRRIYVRVNHQGHRKTRVFNSTKGAQEYAAQVEAMLKLGKVADVFTDPAPPPPVPPAPTFQEIASRWLAVDASTLKATTRDDYQNILAKHLLPIFGPRPITEITSADVENWWVQLRSKGLSISHTSAIRGVLAGILRRAVNCGDIARNPVDALPRRRGREDKERRQAEWLTETELASILAVARQRWPRYHPVLLTIASTGLRYGEAIALQVGDVDLDRRTISIRRRIRKRMIGSPKSGKPRTVDVPKSTIEVLRGWIAAVRAEAAVRGEEAYWLFPSASGKPVDDTEPRCALRKIVRAAGIQRRITPHTLRHTYASLALQRGVPLLVVSRQLGHASVAITADVYGHLAPDATRQAADAWEAILTSPGRNLGATHSQDPT